jgi:hypothetical protein
MYVVDGGHVMTTELIESGCKNCGQTLPASYDEEIGEMHVDDEGHDCGRFDLFVHVEREGGS